MASNTEYLGNVRLFERIDREKLEAFGASCMRRKLDAGEVLFLEGEVPDGLYVIVSGKLRIERLAENGIAQVLAVRRSGDVIGEMGLIDGKPRSAQAVAQTKCRLLFLSKVAFQTQVLAEPTMTFVLLETLSLRIREGAQLLLDSRSKSVSERLLDLLRNQVDDAGWVQLDQSQAALSEYLGCTREAINRAFSQLEKDKKIRRESRRMIQVIES